MPESRTYVVRQTREVLVTAVCLSDAVLLAQTAFTFGQYKSEPSIPEEHAPANVWGNTIDRVKDVSLWVESTR